MPIQKSCYLNTQVHRLEFHIRMETLETTLETILETISETILHRISIHDFKNNQNL